MNRPVAIDFSSACTCVFLLFPLARWLVGGAVAVSLSVRIDSRQRQKLDGSALVVVWTRCSRGTGLPHSEFANIE